MFTTHDTANIRSENGACDGSEISAQYTKDMDKS